VTTYRPTGTRVERADRHWPTGGDPDGPVCQGSYEPTDAPVVVSLEAERTARWRRNAGGPSLNEFLVSKGER
jgi:hypothetical protein